MSKDYLIFKYIVHNSSCAFIWDSFLVNYMIYFNFCRCFVLIENSCFDNPSRLDRVSERTNPEEMYLEVGLFSTFGSIINQCSPDIYEVSLSITIVIYLVFMF